MIQNLGCYKDVGYGWNLQSYFCVVKCGDQDWLNFVNIVLYEVMIGVEFDVYVKFFKIWFGKDLVLLQIGFLVEYK